MFSFSFGEILVIATVGLLVIGPERLPETARFLGHLFGRIRRQVGEVRADIRREMQLEDMKGIHREFSDAARGANRAFQSAARGASEEAGKIQAEVMEEAKDSGAAGAEKTGGQAEDVAKKPLTAGK